MNVEREIRDADRRIQQQINASARAALVRIGVDVDAMEREEAEQRLREGRERFAAFGAAVGAAANTLLGLAIAFAEGVKAAMAAELKELP